MLKLFVGLILIISVNIKGQSNRFVYEYKSVKDSTRKDLINNETYYLDTFKTGSKFYSYKDYKSDSLAKIEGETAFNFSDKVLKIYPKYEISFTSKIGSDIFKVYDERQMIWKIFPETLKIDSWKCQKATTNFAGRNWTAWFSAEIPLQDGPYKFHGLPGLIVKIEDDTKSHTFELKSILKLLDLKPNSDLIEERSIAISRAKFIKAFKEYRLDPMKGWRQMGIVKSKDDLSPDNEFLKNMSDNKKRQIEKDNNILEFDLLQ